MTLHPPSELSVTVVLWIWWVVCTPSVTVRSLVLEGQVRDRREEKSREGERQKDGRRNGGWKGGERQKEGKRE